ncbi:uncharacterized protein TNCT_681311 [Trichonephila clavata]|uniref:Uncharacterized protein n=1 Tax=Trichonephila clavata TaxID=2740835 RepID=A0A8X6HUQ8_TRICU|nr:uncharacterized protein TNCT_681311 [Trichonephila clavata]
MYLSFILCLPFLCLIAARPWNINDLEAGVDVIPQASSASLTKTIDSMTNSFSKALKIASPGLTPVLSFSALAYMGYVGSVMLFPSALEGIGLPLLEDFKFEPRGTRAVETGFIDSLATGFMKDMISRTEAADILRNTSANALKDGMSRLKKTTRFMNLGLGSLEGIVNRIIKNLSPECLARTMCRIGQLTSFHLPALGPMLRSINTFDLDEYSQALIEGTTIGDCSAVHFQCPLEA